MRLFLEDNKPFDFKKPIQVFLGTSVGAVVELSLDRNTGSNTEYSFKYLRRVNFDELELCKGVERSLQSGQSQSVSKIIVNSIREQVHVVYDNFITSMPMCSSCR